MKSTIKKLEGTERQLSINIPREDVDEVFDAVLNEIRKTAKVAGFRPGNAPLDIIRNKYRKDADEELKERLITRYYARAVREHEIDPVSYPELTDVVLDASGFSFKAKVDISPEVNLKKYKGLKVTRKEVRVTEEEIDETLSRLRNMNAEFDVIERPLEKGDFAICDVETVIDGKPVSRRHENMWVEVNKEMSLMGIGEQLCGLKKGDKKDIEATLPEKYPDKNFAGKKAVFNVEVKETREKKLPELNDDFAVKMGKENMPEVREEIKAQLLEKKGEDARLDMQEQIVTQLLKKHDFDLPPSMVKRQFKVLTERVEEELKKKGIEKEVIESHKEKMKEQLQSEAEDKVKLYFILESIADSEKIDVTDEDINEWLKSLAAAYNQSFENVKKYYDQHELIGGVKAQIREQKTLDALVEQAEFPGKEDKSKKE
ncbi:MAG: trigger factor [Candidatus Omnitrophota bacterium]